MSNLLLLVWSAKEVLVSRSLQSNVQEPAVWLRANAINRLFLEFQNNLSLPTLALTIDGKYIIWNCMKYLGATFWYIFVPGWQWQLCQNWFYFIRKVTFFYKNWDRFVFRKYLMSAFQSSCLYFDWIMPKQSGNCTVSRTLSLGRREVVWFYLFAFLTKPFWSEKSSTL